MMEIIVRKYEIFLCMINNKSYYILSVLFVFLFLVIFQFNATHETSQMTMKADHWDDEYVLGKAVLHWGSDDRKGSEHTLHSQRFPLEIQFIHYKLSKGSMKEAAKVDEGIMIASVLYAVKKLKISL